MNPQGNARVRASASTREVGCAMALSYDTSLGMIAKTLRAKSEDITHEPMPERWVDLIRYLDEQERKRAAQAEAEPRVSPPHKAN
jgi:hypothetical protein